MARRHEVFITDEQWERIRPFIPARKRSRQGGRPAAPDRACLEGILWVLRSGARWRDLPERYPSPSTCWRRLVEWEGEGVLVKIWHAFLDALGQALAFGGARKPEVHRQRVVQDQRVFDVQIRLGGRA